METSDNKNFWEKVAKLYTPMQEKSNKDIYSQTIEQIKGYLNKDMQVLEIASGTGQFTFALCDDVASYEATDFSKKMIIEAQKIRSDGITYSVQDATKLTYPDASFDTVIIANALHVMPDPSTALSEIYRVLKPHGTLIAPTFVYEGNINKTRLWFLEKFGFHTFHKWTAVEYEKYISNRHFQIQKNQTFSGKLLPECLIIAIKI